MKKKIKDLTLEECMKICNKQKLNCNKCPLNCCWFGIKQCPAFLETEVEVDEN